MHKYLYNSINLLKTNVIKILNSEDLRLSLKKLYAETKKGYISFINNKYINLN